MSDRVVIVGGPRRGKSTFARSLGVPVMCTDPRSLVKDPLDGVEYLPESRAEWSDASQYIADVWFTRPGPWAIEGVATARALRKWFEGNREPPCDAVLLFVGPHPRAEVTPGQEAMAKGVMTVWSDVAPRLQGITSSPHLPGLAR